VPVTKTIRINVHGHNDSYDESENLRFSVTMQSRAYLDLLLRIPKQQCINLIRCIKSYISPECPVFIIMNVLIS
jgi:hypothetical protein